MAEKMQARCVPSRQAGLNQWFHREEQSMNIYQAKDSGGMRREAALVKL